MSKAVCDCGRVYRVLPGYNDAPCPFPLEKTCHVDEMLVVIDLRCVTCQKVIGHQVVSGTREILNRWKLFDELFQLD